MDITLYTKNVEKKPYNIITYSAINSFLECPMKYFFRYVTKIIPIEKSAVLTIGSIFHESIDLYYKTGNVPNDFISNECQKKDSYLTSNEDIMLQGMVSGFVNYFKNSPYEVLKDKTEIIFDKQISGKMNYHRCGKSDAQMVHKKTKVVYLGEWKTTSQLSLYTDKIKVDNQGNNYLWAFEDDKPQGVIFRIARKSLLRIKKNESIKDFRKRIFDDYINRPEENFREEIVYLDEAGLKRWKYEFNQILNQIIAFRESDSWYRNTNSCYNYSRLCPYYHICQVTNLSDFDLIKQSHYIECEPGEELFEVVES